MGIVIQGILKIPKDRVTRAKEGDKEAFSEIIEEEKLSLYRVAKGILKDEDKCFDAISNTIVKAYINIKKLRKTEYFKTWLIKILINECRDILKEDKKIVYTDKAIEKEYKDSYEDFDLINGINSLEEEFREVIILYYFEDLKGEEIAKVLNIKENTVRTRLHRAKNKLYEILK
ncbi:sigma-70 family RNA polymerase sigma factor [uncultured Clostridium sp.]|uniref:sigma-70 family RNA polymerase sigma factor n=1 Tax=uncultured Clostridium sp. TaxID=59620 RepID=UPI00262FB9B7|nr:sigma-70 family RNA polymerase sigma factor [uncultured Clostridium sp.]